MRIVLYLGILLLSSGLWAQCPGGKYGLRFNTNDSISTPRQDSMMQNLTQKGLGFLVISENWRTLQQKKDSGRFGEFVDRLRYAKSTLGFDSIAFIVANPSAKSNYMPPVYCGNPWTDTHTRQAMFSFYTGVLDSIGDMVDYIIWGSDADKYFKTRPEQIDSFLKFTRDIGQLVHTNHPHIRFSVGFSYNAFKFGNRMADSCFSYSDFRAFSFNPAAADYTSVNGLTDTIASRLQWAVGNTNLPWVIYDAEYPSSPNILSSEEVQKNFLQAVFGYTSTSDFEAVLFRYYSDFDSVQVSDQMNYYLSWAENAKYYFSSLGISDLHGNMKESGTYFAHVLDSLCIHQSIADARPEGTILIYPNPFAKELNFEVQGKNHAVINIYMQDGRLLKHVEYTSGTSLSIDTQQWSSGIYILYYQDSYNYHSFKLLKQ